ncbi:MAG TPA: tetratricopeptide repeat protein, partial [Fimbriimonadaceae bacterium]|nr:tetratricopeptide repeat protein [Fimbriimonadaceae bacterium]
LFFTYYWVAKRGQPLETMPPLVLGGAPVSQAELDYQETQKKLALARVAEERGDFALAENLYRQAIELRPKGLLARYHLALLMDRLHRDADALAAYEHLIAGHPKSRSSTQEDPRVLARLGDLRAKFGRTEDAKKAYKLAIHHAEEMQGRPRPTPRSEELNVLRACAHLAAARRLYSGDPQVLVHCEIAFKEDPFNWLVRFYRARAFRAAGRPLDYRNELFAAELLVPKGETAVADELRSSFLSSKGAKVVLKPNGEVEVTIIDPLPKKQGGGR